MGDMLNFPIMKPHKYETSDLVKLIKERENRDDSKINLLEIKGMWLELLTRPEVRYAKNSDEKMKKISNILLKLNKKLRNFK